MPNEDHPLLASPQEPWYGSASEPAYQRQDLGQQLAEARRPNLYVHGDATYGWSVKEEAPNYQDLTGYGQFFLRDQLNSLENPRGLLGENQSNTYEQRKLLAESQGKTFDPVKGSEDALTQFIPFYSNQQNDIAPILEESDPNWNGTEEWRAWSKQYPEIANYLTTARQVNPEDTFAKTHNRTAFMYIVNSELTKAKLQQEIDEYDKSAGTYNRYTQFLGGGAVRQLLLDSDTAKTLGLSVLGKGLGAAVSVAKAALPEASALARGLGVIQKAGSIHSVLAENLKLGTAGALAAEGFVAGAGYDAQHQAGVNDLAHWLGQSGHEWDVSDTLQSGVLGSVLGLSAWGGVRAIGAMTNSGSALEASTKALVEAGMGDTPLARHGLTTEGLTLQRLEEDGLSKINRTLSASSDDRLGFVLSKPVIEESGRTVAQVGQFVDGIAALKKSGVSLSDDALMEAVNDFLDQGELKHLTTSERTAVEAATAREEALAIKQANPEWVASMEKRKAGWIEAANRARALADNQTLDRAAIDEVLAPVGLKDVKVALTKSTLMDAINREFKAVENMLTKPADPGAAAKSVVPTLSLGAYEPKSSAGRLLRDLQVQFNTIAESKKLGGTTSVTAQKAAREEIKKLSASLKQLYGVAPKVQKATKAVARVSTKTLDKMAPKDQVDYINTIMDGIEATPNQVMEGTNFINRALKAVGYEGKLKEFLLSRTGINATARSKQQTIREAVGLLFGSPDYNSRVFSGRGGAGVSAVAAMDRAVRDIAPIRGFLEEIANRQGVSEDAYREFNNLVESRMNTKGKMPAGHPLEKEGNQLLSMWQSYVDQVARRGKATGSLRPSKEAKDSIFLPSVVNHNYLRAHFKEAAQHLAVVWQKQAENSEFLNPEFMEQLGWIERPVDRYGNRIGSIAVPDNSPVKDLVKSKFIAKKDLPPVIRAEYDAAVKDPNRLLKTAELYWSRSLGEDVRGSDVRSVNDKVYGANSRNPHRRKITQAMLEANPELKQYYNRDLFTLFERYARSAGFKSHVGESIQRAFGVNATLGQMMNTLESRMNRDHLGNPEMQEEIKTAFDKAHDMVAWMGGYLPDGSASYATWKRYSADVITKAGFLAVAGGIGVSSSAEALFKTFTTIHSPADWGRNVKALIRGLFADRSVQREELAGLMHDSRRLAVGYSHQLSTGRMDYAHELTTRGMLTRPWRDTWATATGEIQSGIAPGRATGTALSTLDALGKTAYVMGGAPRITHATEIMVAGGAQREFMRYSDALIKLRDYLKTNPINPVELGGGKSDLNKAHNAFKQAARSAGFGGRWDLAEKYLRWDLNGDGIVESLQKAADQSGVKGRIHVKTHDLLDVYSKMPAGREKDALYEAIQRHSQYVDDAITESMGETTAWSARTDDRSPWGKALDLFTNYMHNTYFHKIGKSASLPARAFLGITTGMVLTETLTGLIQNYLNGMTVDEMLKQWDTPSEASLSMLSNSMRISLFGANSFIPKYVADSAIDSYNKMAGNDPINAYQPKFGGVVGGGVDSIVRLGKGANRWATALTPQDSDKAKKMTLNAGIKFLPVINSFYGKLGVRMFTDWKERQPYGASNSYSPVGTGRSIWGDEDSVQSQTNNPAPKPQPQTPVPSSFNLAETLTKRK